MNDQISNFLRILHDNIFEQKFYSSPEEIDILPFEKDDIPFGMNEEDFTEADTLEYHELNGFKIYDDLEDFLNQHMREFKIDFIANGFSKNKVLKTEIIQQVNTAKTDLLELKQTTSMFKDAAFNALIRLKTNICDEVISFITNQENKIKSHGQRDNNHPNRLKQKEVVILFYHLRKLGLIDENIPNNVYAQYISDITGYESEKIRQDLSNILDESTSTDKLRFQQNDYEGIKRKLEQKIIKAIVADLEIKFPDLP